MLYCTARQFNMFWKGLIVLVVTQFAISAPAKRLDVLQLSSPLKVEQRALVLGVGMYCNLHVLC